MQFKRMKSFDGSVSDEYVEYTDDVGQLWIVPKGHRFWDIYQLWLDEGNEPLDAT